MDVKDNILNTISNDEAKKPINLEDEDKILLDKVKLRRDDCERFLKPKIMEWEKQLRFFDGDHWQVAGVSVPSYKSDLVINKYFSAVRSLVAFETDAKPDPEVEAMIDPTDPMAETITLGAKKLEGALDHRWDTAQIPSILTEIYYDRYNFDDGFGMYFWNSEIDDVDFEQLKPFELFVAPGSTCIEDAEYVIVKKLRNRKWFETFYPDLADKIKFESVVGIGSTSGGVPLANLKTEYENVAPVYHYFSDEIWIDFMDDRILDKKKNPFWEWRTPEEQQAEILAIYGVLPTNWKPVRNHLRKPEKPIIHFKGYHLGGEFYSRSLIKQVAKLNFAINKRKCQIHDNADAVGNAQKVIDPSVPKEMVDLITSEPGLKIRIKPELYRTEPGIPLPEFIFLDLQHSEQKFDDLMGHHEISRGATASKRQTKTEALILREADITPVRLLMRNGEVAITKLLNGWTQLIMLFYDQPHYIGGFGIRLGEMRGQIITRDDVPDNLSIIIKVGSTLPTSKETKRMEWQADLQRGVLDPLTYLELMGYPNPRKILQRALNYWRYGVISDEPINVAQPPVQGQSAPVSAEVTQ